MKKLGDIGMAEVSAAYYQRCAAWTLENAGLIKSLNLSALQQRHREANRELQAIVDKIAATPATTLGGIKIKIGLRHLTGSDLDDSIFNDLEGLRA